MTKKLFFSITTLLIFCANSSAQLDKTTLYKTILDRDSLLFSIDLTPAT
jgi:hypothetical protein